MTFILFPDEKVRLLTLKLPRLRAATLHLFQNDYTPDDESEPDDFEEASFPGYSSVSLEDFTNAYLNPFNQGETDTPLLLFTMTGAAPTNNIYGWYMTDAADELMMAERNPGAPVPMNAVGAEYPVLLQFLEY